jgi:hypothetical protein
MKKALLLIALGIAAGYWIGFNDAQEHSRNIVARLVARAGGGNRDRVRNDIDATMERVERR